MHSMLQIMGGFRITTLFFHYFFSGESKYQIKIKYPPLDAFLSYIGPNHLISMREHQPRPHDAAYPALCQLFKSHAN